MKVSGWKKVKKNRGKGINKNRKKVIKKGEEGRN